jgi:RNA polymerase sigma-70 factor (ECF subfamily)
VALTAVDRALVQRCLTHQANAWNDFVDRYLGLIYHVIHHTAHLRSVSLQPEDVEDVAAEILLQIVANDYAVLRQFRGQASLATYLTVIARRICIHELTRRAGQLEATTAHRTDGKAGVADREDRPKTEVGLESLEEVARLLRKLPARERQVVRLFYLEGRTYEEISTELHVPVNSIGPILSRARQKLLATASLPHRIRLGQPSRSRRKVNRKKQGRSWSEWSKSPGLQMQAQGLQPLGLPLTTYYPLLCLFHPLIQPFQVRPHIKRPIQILCSIMSARAQEEIQSFQKVRHQRWCSPRLSTHLKNAVEQFGAVGHLLQGDAALVLGTGQQPGFGLVHPRTPQWILQPGFYQALVADRLRDCSELCHLRCSSKV